MKNQKSTSTIIKYVIGLTILMLVVTYFVFFQLGKYVGHLLGSI